MPLGAVQDRDFDIVFGDEIIDEVAFGSVEQPVLVERPDFLFNQLALLVEMGPKVEVPEERFAIVVVRNVDLPVQACGVTELSPAKDGASGLDAERLYKWWDTDSAPLGASAGNASKSAGLSCFSTAIVR
jgi:hypothetical protein